MAQSENAEWAWERIDRPKQTLQSEANNSYPQLTRANGKLSEWAAYVARKVADVESQLNPNAEGQAPNNNGA